MKLFPARRVGSWTAVLGAGCGAAIATGAVLAGCRTPLPEEPVGRAEPTVLAPAELQWRSIEPAPAMEVITGDYGPSARFRCPFDTAPLVERFSWDAGVTQDFSGVESLDIPLRLTGPQSVASLSLYFRSGSGWYHVTLPHPAPSGRWSVVRVSLEAARTEGRPAGWSRIDAVRLSVWRAGASAAELVVGPVRAVGVMGRDMLVAVVRPPADHAGPETRFARQLAEDTVRDLRRLGVRCALFDGRDLLDRSVWRSARVLVVPYYPDLPAAVVELLREFVESGGRLIIAYSVPPALRDAVGVEGGDHLRDEARRRFAEIRPLAGSLPGAPSSLRQSSHNIRAFRPIAGRSEPLADWYDADGQPAGHAAIVGSDRGMVLSHVLFADDRDARARMWLAMVVRLAPEVGAVTVRTALEALPSAVGRKGWSDAIAEIRGLAPRSREVRQDLAAAETARAEAIRLMRRDRHVEAMERLDEARGRLIRAAALAQPPTPLRFRGFWCHDAYGVRGRTWEEAARRLAGNGFTAVLPNVCWGGVAYYPSQVLPVAPEVRERGDALAACVAAARRYGMEVHAWRVNWNLGPAPADFVARLRAEGRLQRGRDGAELRWLCPSHPDNQRLEVEAMLEIAARYDVDGLHFDYIRYPDSDHCVCDGCRARFEAEIGRVVPQWPDDLRSNEWRAEWNEWRRRQISGVVEEVHRRARAVRPGLKLSAAVFREWERDRDHVAQDWKLWCERGWLDFVCPMNYTDSAARFAQLVERQREWAGTVPLYPGIGASASSSRLGVMEVIEQVRIAERLGAAGFVVFNYGVAEYEELVPLLGLGILRPVR